MMKINIILKTEEGLLVLLSIYLFSLLSYAWWLFPALFLAPDIGMLGYLINKKAGALIYNLFHHKGLAIVIYIFGIFSQNELMQLTGVIILGHASFDRLLGYGLKYAEGFKYTHLGNLN